MKRYSPSIAALIRLLGSYRGAALVGPLFFGLVSVLLGADTNWDLQNYHLYNAYAILNGKLEIDLAPAGFQTYFNPTLDVPYYLAMQYLPPRLVGFLMGAVHGLNLVLLLAICRAVLAKLTPQDNPSIPALLAIAGCLSANFLSEVGSTMGDVTTALFCMTSILIVLTNQRRMSAGVRSGWPFMLMAGVSMGMGIGLKLTNAPYAVAICLALFALPNTLRVNFKSAFVFGAGVLIGIACFNGYWFYLMWSTFGYPLFPQFNRTFTSPLAAAISVGDLSWLPKTIWQQIGWPFIISLDAQKAGQIAIRQIVWALAYALLLALAAQHVYRRLVNRRKVNAQGGRLDAMERFILVIVVLGFFIWMKLFSVYRYMVPMDMLAPLVVFILCKAVFPYRWAKRIALISLTLAVLVVLSGTRTWSHAPWGETLLHAEVPTIGDPARTTVLMVEGDPPWAWLAIPFPVEVSFVQIAGNFPQGPAYAGRVRDILAQRGGPVFVLFSGAKDEAAEKAARIRAQAERVGLTSSAGRCQALAWLLKTFKLRATVLPVDPHAAVACNLEVLSRQPRIDIDLANRLERAKARESLLPYRLAIDEQSCSFHRAGIASEQRLYQWCAVRPLPGRD